ncbi:uncharacterized protein ATNIH1004_001510 [Aspergillus tanneri]|uniref:SUMO-targeted ubiquitin ligase complex subunit slx8 n=1 Tax=Aspergillus tanneri TaxID=1220188 RepID=A0A5M9MZR5_9EURO|nr:SUMO-targeted ubiquitin ligase complex subunit slx8 [Aspergillus tanneri]KAA8652605.1 SUMO-targeted ubiquitin ligase complex subunit slx8 [Aspergillus tanneri]
MNPSNYASGLFDYYSSYPDDQPSGSYSPVGPSASTSHGRKRRRLSHSDFGAVSVPSELDPGDDGENELYASIDLTTVDESSSLSRTLAKQREDAIRAQHTVDDERGRSVLTAYKCPVCMDTPVDATSTACGHLFCHKCIIDTLKFSEEQRADSTGKTPRGTCPVCRKPLTRSDVPGPRRNLIPLQLKLTARKRNDAVDRT